jgi:hypothetical protein
VGSPEGGEVDRVDAEFEYLRRLISKESRSCRTYINRGRRRTIPAQQIIISGTLSHEVNILVASRSIVNSATVNVTLCSEETHAAYRQLNCLDARTRTLTFPITFVSFDSVRETRTRRISAPFLARWIANASPSP